MVFTCYEPDLFPRQPFSSRHRRLAADGREPASTRTAVLKWPADRSRKLILPPPHSGHAASFPYFPFEVKPRCHERAVFRIRDSQDKLRPKRSFLTKKNSHNARQYPYEVYSGYEFAFRSGNLHVKPNSAFTNEKANVTVLLNYYKSNLVQLNGQLSSLNGVHSSKRTYFFLLKKTRFVF